MDIPTTAQTTPLQVLQLERLARVLERRQEHARHQRQGDNRFDKELKLQRKGLDLAAYGLYEDCVALGLRARADELVAKYQVEEG